MIIDGVILCNKCKKPKEYNRINRIKGVHCNCGRPSKWETPEKLEADIKKYVNDCKENKLVPTVHSLALFLDCDPELIYYYGEKQEFFSIIKRAKDFIISFQQQFLFKTGYNPAGTIFSLCNMTKMNQFKFENTNRQEITSNINVLVDSFKELDTRKLVEANKPLELADK